MWPALLWPANDVPLTLQKHLTSARKAQSQNKDELVAVTYLADSLRGCVRRSGVHGT